MYRLYVSEGVVLGKRLLGESNVLVTILTKDLGLVHAKAQSARKEESKLRYGLEALTQAKFSFVRGKHEWKLTGVEHVSHGFIAPEAARRQSTGRVARLLLRLIHGEEQNTALYTTVVEGLEALTRGVDVEAVLVLRILTHLGYLPQTPELEPFIKKDFFSIELSQEVAASRAFLIRSINDSLHATGL